MHKFLLFLLIASTTCPALTLRQKIGIFDPCAVELVPTLQTVQQRIAAMRDYVRAEYGWTNQQSQVVWPSRNLRHTPILTEERLEEIFALMREESSSLRKEVRDQIASFSRRDRKLWAIYLSGPYIRLVPFVNEYLDIAVRADYYLAPEGTIADIGSGPGVLSAVLQILKPHRRVLGIDNSGNAQQMMFRLFLDNLGLNFQLVGYDINKFQRPDSWESWSGAFVNNACYPIADKERFFKMIFHGLKPGAHFIFNEGPPEITNPYAKIYIQESIIRSAYANDAPLNEFDVAYILGLNYETLMKDLVSTEDYIEMAKQAGFEHVSAFDPRTNSYVPYVPTFLGLDNFVIFRKPKRALYGY